jgi:hypothetical protein
MVNNVDFQKADLGKAIDTLVGSSGYNRVFDAAQTSAIEAKLGNPLPDAIKADGRVSEQELTDYLAGRIKEGYLALDNGNFVSGSRVAEEAAINVAVSAPPVPTGEPADESGQGGWYQPSLPNTTDPTQSDYISPDDSYNPQASDSNTGLTYGEEYLGGVYQGSSTEPVIEASDTSKLNSGGVIEEDSSAVSSPTDIGAEVVTSPLVDYKRDTRDSGFAYPWSAAKSVGVDDVPATIEKAVGFMNATEGKQYHYDKVKGTITSKDGGFIKKDDVQALNNIIVKYHKDGFALPENASARAQEVTGGSIGNPPSNRPIFDDITGGAVRIDANKQVSSLTGNQNTGIVGGGVRPRPLEGGLTLP